MRARVPSVWDWSFAVYRQTEARTKKLWMELIIKERQQSSGSGPRRIWQVEKPLGLMPWPFSQKLMIFAMETKLFNVYIYFPETKTLFQKYI